ncbi:MAG: FliA/WhiG family RNA polymerase sigma factor [Candidatus Cloacimonetes bacterium]|nr:FliA/WhiG family RNA polymerase sigma factor [Candidatus Cloacimonadota bacterium]
MDPEEIKLWELYKSTSRPELQEKIVVKYLKLVHFLAHRLVSFSTPSLDREDLYSAGVIGLLEAIERFDLTKNVSFKTYATLRIKGAIIDEIRRFDWVPRSVRKKSKLIDATIHKLFAELDRLPTDQEIAEELELSMTEYYQLTDSLGPLNLSSLDSTYDSEQGEQNYANMLSDDYDVEVEENKQIMRENLIDSIQSLPERERTVISLYYYENLNLKEIAAVLEVTESRISQIHTAAINKLRAMMQKKRL